MPSKYKSTQKTIKSIFSEIHGNFPDLSFQKCLILTLKRARKNGLYYSSSRATGVSSAVWDFWANKAPLDRPQKPAISGKIWAMVLCIPTSHRTGSKKGQRLSQGVSPQWGYTYINIRRQAFYGLWECLGVWKVSHGETLPPGWANMGH